MVIVNAEPQTEAPIAKPNGGPPLHEAEVSPTALGMGLQLSRANTMALTRLQLALTSGDRQQAMEAMDRLHVLDAELERLVNHLRAEDEDPDWQAITKHLSDQKLAIAFEKLALASEISGPDLHSPPVPLPRQDEEAPPPLPDWPALPSVEPTEWKPASHSLIGLLLALLLTIGLAAAAVVMTTAT